MLMANRKFLKRCTSQYSYLTPIAKCQVPEYREKDLLSPILLLLMLEQEEKLVD